jgi:kinase
MASAGVVHSSVGFQNDTSSSSDADRLRNEMSNMSLRGDKVILFSVE